MAEEAPFGILLLLELQVEVPEFILGALVGLYFLVFDDLAEARGDLLGDILQGERFWQPPHEDLVIGVPFPHEDLVAAGGELLDVADLFNFRGGNHHEGLELALLPPQQDILGPQGGLGQEADDERLGLEFGQHWHLVQHHWLAGLIGLHIYNQFNIFKDNGWGRNIKDR